MATTVTSYRDKRHDEDSRWLNWLATSFLVINLMLLIAAIFMWQQRRPTQTVAARGAVPAVASSTGGADVAADTPASMAPAGAPGQVGPAAMPFELAPATAVRALRAPAEQPVNSLAGPLRPGDLDADGDVDIFDIVLYATNPQVADVNADSTIDVRDLIALDAGYGSSGPQQ